MPHNEAALESLIAQVLRTIFPTYKEVKVEHQKSFSIKFGHHMVSVDLKDPKKYPSRAIFDVLLTIGGKPMILLELKREGLELTDDDINQGLSYALLIDPMPPLTIISNGDKNLIYITYNREKISEDIIDLELLQDKIDNSFKIAMNEFKDAVQTLLNKDYSFFSSVINSSSKEKFDLKTGTIDQFDKVICENLLIRREIIADIEQVFSTENRHVGIVGPAFSGKTNLLYQIFKTIDTSKDFAFYIDCNDFNVSILQDLATDMSNSSKIYLNKENIREFFTNSLGHEVNFYLLIDNFNSYVPSGVMQEILELMQMFQSANHKVVFTVDEFNLEKLVSVKNRNYKTSIGEMSKILSLRDLELSEYKQATDLMLDNYRVFIAHGGQMASEYRQPRILRHLASCFKHDLQIEGAQSIPAVPNQEVLNFICTNPAYPRELYEFYKKISTCFSKEYYLRKKNAELSTIAFLSGAVTTKTYEELFKKDLKKLLRSGFVVTRYLSNGTAVIYPKIPELVAFYAVDTILPKLLGAKKKGKSIKEIVAKFVDLIAPLPCLDIIGANILEQFIQIGETDLFLGIVEELLSMAPKKEAIEGEMSALAYFEDVGHVKINMVPDLPEITDPNIKSTEVVLSGDSDLGSFISNYLPYPILSQLASRIFILGDGQINETTLHSHRFLLGKVASHPDFILRSDGKSIRGITNISLHDFDSGEVVCHREGIVEAIVQSIQQCYLSQPQYIDRLFRDALKNNYSFLLWRIFLALSPLANSVNTEIREGAMLIISDLLNHRDDLPIC